MGERNRKYIQGLLLKVLERKANTESLSCIGMLFFQERNVERDGIFVGEGLGVGREVVVGEAFGPTYTIAHSYLVNEGG